MTCGNFPRSRAVIEPLSVANMPVKSPAIEGLIAGLDLGMIAVLTNRLVGFPLDLFTEECTLEAFSVANFLEDVVTGVIIDVLAITAIDLAADIEADVDANICVADNTASEFIPTALSGVSLLCTGGA